MRVTLSCGVDDLTIWFAPAVTPVREIAVEGLPNAWLLFTGAGLKALRLIGLRALCPYELAKVAHAHAGGEVQAELPATYDLSCDMGYVSLDKRGPASVDYTIATDDGVCIDIGKDGVVLGLELFSPSRLLPELVQAHGRA